MERFGSRGQPLVSTGGERHLRAGTGVNSCVNQTGQNVRGCYQYVPTNSYAFTNGAYLLSNGNFTGNPTFGPLAPFGIYVYYRRAL